jgi:spore coat protein A
MTKKVSMLLAIVAVLAFALPASAAQSPQLPLAGAAIPQFVDPLPVLDIVGSTMATVVGNTGQQLSVRMCEFKANVLPAGAVVGYTGTWVWGYLVDPSGDSTCDQLIATYGDANGVIDTYIGPVVLAERGIPTEIKWINDLGSTATTNVLSYKYSTDLTLHWADPQNLGGMHNMCNHTAGVPAAGSDCAQNYAGPIPAAVHLHGGEVPPQIDGGPDAWYTSDGSAVGVGYYSMDSLAPKNYAIYRYPNTQEAAPIWFHDHTLGATRLNVFSGLAGAYLIADPGLALPAGLAGYGLDNGGTFEPTVPLVIQDRRFDTNGQLFFPADTAGGLLWSTNPEHPYWVPEFEGDVIVVNGKAWPRFDVQEKRYRFLFLNGSNARTYEMFLVDPVTGAAGPNMWVIATDGGYLDAPVPVTKLTMMPGERYEVIIDFAGFANANGWLLKNTAKTPFPAGVAPQGTTTGRIMLFNVAPGAVANASYNPALGTPILAGADVIQRLANPATGTLATGVAVQKTRVLTLNEVMAMGKTVTDPVTGVANTAYPGGPLEVLVNNTKWSGERITGVTNGMYDFTPLPGSTPDNNGNHLTELPTEGETEIWEIANLTADAHPIHLHLVQFQLINRQRFNMTKYMGDYNAAFPVGYDFVAGQQTAGGVFIPAFGPPLAIDGSDPLSNGKLGGNVDVDAVSAKNGRPLYLQGKATPPAANEAGWKDTVIMYPGEVTRIAVRWAPTDLPATTAPAAAYFPFDPSGGYSATGTFDYGYVWHCHIIDHEDNEMMRPDAVYPNTDPAVLRSYTGY